MKSVAQLNEELRERSGKVVGSPAAGFFYDLLLNGGISPGRLESLLQEAERGPLEGNAYVFTNGWLAHYALDIEDRLFRLMLKTGDVTRTEESRSSSSTMPTL